MVIVNQCWSVSTVCSSKLSDCLVCFHDREEPIERVVVFTDMQIWDSTPFTARDNQTVKAAFDAYRNEVSSDTALYLVDLASYGALVTPEGYENVYNVSGWSENVLSFIEHAENPKQVIDEIDAFEPA